LRFHLKLAIMARFFILSALSLLCLASFLTANLTNEYNHAAYLDPAEDYKLYWSVKDSDKSIHFAVEVATAGWIGFGISAGLSGSMIGADIAIGWVDSQGKGHLKDYHGQEAKNGLPILDKSQDYNLVGSSESNGVTVLKFTRKLVTCDKEDRSIQLGTIKVIYALGTQDVLSYHYGKRGAKSLNLLNYVKNTPPPTTAKYFDALSRNVAVPAVRTTYWCQAMKVANLVTLSKKHHIIEVEPLLNKKDSGVLRHNVLYICDRSINEKDLNVTGSCYNNQNMPSSIIECIRSTPMYAWGAGGVNFRFPDHVGWPIGAKDSMKYVVLETKFDNPKKRSDLVVTSGLRFYYDAPRQYDAATMSVGQSNSLSLTIPPKQENWTVSAACVKSCTSRMDKARALPEGGIKFFASSPHARKAGRGLWTKIVRDGKEIVEINRDDNFDVNYQQTYLLRNEVLFKPGDEIINYCRYNTMDRSDAIIGGFSTNDEMCLNFIMYYPPVNLSICITGDVRVARDFSIKYGNLETNAQPPHFKNWTGVKWNKTMVDELKALYAYQGKDAVFSICQGGVGDVVLPVTLEPRPTVKEPLRPKKDVCKESGNNNASLPKVNILTLSLLGILASYKLLNT